MILATAGIETDAVLRDKVTFADMVSGATNEVTNSGYAKKVLTSTDITSFAPDQAGDQLLLDIPDLTWVSVGAGDGWSDFVLGYDPSSAGVTMSLIEPISLHDFVLTPDRVTVPLAA